MTTDQIIITEKEVGLTDKEFAREADRQEAITDNRKTRYAKYSPHLILSSQFLSLKKRN